MTIQDITYSGSPTPTRWNGEPKNPGRRYYDMAGKFGVRPRCSVNHDAVEEGLAELADSYLGPDDTDQLDVLDENPGPDMFGSDDGSHAVFSLEDLGIPHSSRTKGYSPRVDFDDNEEPSDFVWGGFGLCNW